MLIFLDRAISVLMMNCYEQIILFSVKMHTLTLGEWDADQFVEYVPTIHGFGPQNHIHQAWFPTSVIPELEK